MDIIDKLKWRYATKKFDKDRNLSSNKINVLKEAFNLTATSFGLQTIKMIVIEDKALRESLVKFSYNQTQVLDASHLLIICIQDKINREDVNEYYNNIKEIRKTSDEILNPYKNDLIKMMEAKTNKEQQQWSKNQAYIALGNLMTVCAVEEIDSCPMEGFISKSFDEILNLNDKGLKSVLLLPVGYRAQDDIFAGFKKVRMDITESVLEI
ncbi:NAD(P)H-dependent oxidoreductase [Seonamhaeicola sp. MEBiC1930]|uniref:NAD(P)H-dependent oxidoreductase n=1 Tax=Seonamhaeicola sp. MEBiC01930 TaxID=2976768 RepID=UPI00325667CA